MAWLSAVPDKKDSKGNASEDRKSRREEYEAKTTEDGEESHFLTMPELQEEAYLVDLWQEAGSASTGGMGMTALSWSDILDWLLAVELELTVWERLMIRRLSQEYCNEYHMASDPSRADPYSVLPDEEARNVVSKNIKSVFSMFKKSAQEPRYTVEERE